jgi:translocation and assembly module TamA
VLVLLAVVAGPVDADIDVDITGVDSAIEKNVRAFLSLERFSERDRLREDTIERLQERVEREVRLALRPFGYYDPKVTSTVSPSADGRDWDVRIDIVPGPPVMLEAIDIQVIGPRATDPAFVEILGNLPLRAGEQLNHASYEKVKNDLQRAAAAYGYLDGRLTRNELIVDPPRLVASAYITFDTGERYSFGKTTISQDVISSELMEKYLRYREGEPYDAVDLLRTQFALDDSQYFSTVEVLPLERDRDTLTVPIEVKAERNRRHRWVFGVGYATDTQWRGTIAWDNRIVNQYGHRFRAALTVSSVEQSVNGTYIWPIGDPALEKIEAQAVWTHKVLADLDTYNTEARVGVTQVLGRWQRVLFTRAVYAITEDATTRTEEYLLIPGISYASVPKGYLGEALFGRQVYAELRGSLEELGSKAPYLQFEVALERVFDVAPKWHLLLRGQLGTTWVDDIDNIPGSERFFAGGDRSVRGFGFNELSPVDADGQKTGGKNLLVGSIEIIRDLPRNLGVAAFFDIGNAFNDWGDPLEYSVGVGARFRLPIATVGFDVAQPLSESDASPRFSINFSPQL